MIEGLWLRPALDEAGERPGLVALPLDDCTRCYKNVPQRTRLLAGCAYEPEAPVNLRPYVQPWSGCGVESRPATDDEPAFPSVCPGYSTSLPEVIEAARARAHWEKGELTQFCRGQASDPMLRALEYLHGAVNTVQRWAMENPRKKAGQ